MKDKLVTFTRRLVSTIAASVLTFSATGGIAPVAFSQVVGTETPQAPASTPGAIDPGKAVVLTIHKILGDPIVEPIEDPVAAAAKMPKLQDIQFKIERLNNVDLTTEAGWTALANMTATDPNLETSVVGTLNTDADGLARISTDNNSQFTVGAYRVTEVNKAGYSVAPPFLISLPYANSDGSWTYSRDVYPKNQKVQANKQVDDTGATIGSNLTYTINAPVPAGDLNAFSIEDKLVSSLTLQNDPPVAVTTTGSSIVALESTDYQDESTDNTLKITFTPAGRDKLQVARVNDPSLQVSVKFAAKVNSIPADGVITNTATITLPNGGTVTTDDLSDDTTSPNVPTSTTFGNLTITKTGPAGTANSALAGATFQLYLCSADANSKYQILGSPLQMAASADAKAPVDSISTDQQAIASGYGIPVSSFSTGGTGLVPNDYCVVETKAPAGFVGNPEPQHVSYDSTTNKFTVEVLNKKDSLIGQLPATGAWGIVLIFLFGLLLLARGLYTSYKDNKAQEA